MSSDLIRNYAEEPWPVAFDETGRAKADPSLAAAAASPFNYATLIRIFYAWRWVVLGAAAAGLGLALIVTMLRTPLYKSSVTLQLNPPSVEIMDNDAAQVGDAVRTQDLMTTYGGLLQSRSVAERAVQQLSLANDPKFVDQRLPPNKRLEVAANKVREGLEVLLPKQGQLVQFTFVSDSPALAADVANAIADGLMSSTVQRRFESSAYARNFLQRQIAKTRAELEHSERELVSYAQQQGIIQTSTTGQAAGSTDSGSPEGQSLTALNQALAEATARRVAAEGAYRAASNEGPTTEETASSQALRQTRAALQGEYQEKLTYMKPSHPEMVSLRSRIAELGRQIDQEGATVAQGHSNTLLADYRAALAAERSLQARVSALKGAVLNLRGRSIQYAILQREVDTSRVLYDALLQRYKEIGVAGGIGTTPVSIVDRAQPPEAPFTPNLLLNLLFGIAGGLAAGVIAAVSLEFLTDTIVSSADVREKLRTACLGVTPKQRESGPLLDQLKDSSSVLSEAYSAIIASLRFSTGEGVPRTFLVTSATPAEGKSSSVLALGVNLARSGKSVLIIDADLRQPAFAAAASEKGLTDLLTNKIGLPGELTRTSFEHLWLLPAGPKPPNPADLLSTARIHEILREAASQFEVVIVDGPPVINLADARLLAAACQHVVFIVESGKPRQVVADALKKIRETGANVTGAVLTKAEEQSSGYGYGYGYRYGYGKALDERRKIFLIEGSPAG